MNLLGISINHRTAPVEIRERLYLTEDQIQSYAQKTKGSLLSEGLVISTCNRTEIYGVPLRPEIDITQLQNSLIEHKSVSNLTSEHFQSFVSGEAIKHLFRVATGIDSLIVGDNQIFKQVKDSFTLADESHFSGFLMKRIFDAAIRTGKRAITETGISEGAVTVSYAAVQLIEKIFSNLNKKSALVIGAGETGEIAAKHLKERGIGRLAITNRTIERAEKLAEKLQARIIPFSYFKDYLHEYDIVLSATSSENLILTKEDIVVSMKKRNYNACVFMDIAIPRDIDPAAKDINYVFYNDIDSLNIIVQQNLAKRKEEIPKVEKIINEEVAAFLKWFGSLEASPTIKTLRDYFESIRAEEFEKNKNRFSEQDQEKLDILTKRIINKILHQPTVAIKKFTEAGSDPDESAMRINIIRELFGLDNTNSKDE